MRTYNFTVNGRAYTIEAENFQVARARLAELVAADSQ
jgi:hypothetical protein